MSDSKCKFQQTTYKIMPFYMLIFLHVLCLQHNKSFKLVNNADGKLHATQRTELSINPLPQCRILTHLGYLAVENIVRKGEIACNKQFLLFSQCFLPYMALIFFIFNALSNVVCNLFQFGPV